MQKIKFCTSTVVLLFILAFTPTAFAEEMAFTADETVSNRITGESIVGNTVNYSQTEILQLEKSLRIMQLEIGTLKNTIKDLQSKVVKSEMADLKNRLETLQEEIFALEGKNSDPLSDYERLLLESSLQTKEPVASASDREIFVESLEEIASSAQQEVSELKQKLVEDLANSPKATVIKETAGAKEAFKEKILDQKAADVEQKAEAEKLANIEVIKLMTKLADGETEVSEAEEEEEVIIEPAPSIITQRSSGRSLFQFPRSLERNTGQGQINTQVVSARTTQAKYLKTSIPTNTDSADGNSAPAEFERQSLSQKSEPFSGRNLVFLGGLLAFALIGFVFWLSRYEKRLFSAAARHFQSLDLPEESPLMPRRKKSSRSNKKIL
ncbi:MAG: hypothetical protein ABIH35_03220 [Patescibacteria group bacterium]